MRKWIAMGLVLAPAAAQAQFGDMLKALGKASTAKVAAPKPAPVAAAANATEITNANFVSAISALVARDGVVEMGEGEPHGYRMPLRLSGVRERNMVALPAKLQLSGYNETYVRCESFTAPGGEGRPVNIAIDDWALETETVEVSNLVIVARQCRVEGAASAGAAPAAAQATAPKERSCVPKADYAGIAAYLDPRMARVGTEPIRSFDQYVFKARKTVKTGNYDMLEGTLYRFDGKVSAGSWVLADEWDCR